MPFNVIKDLYRRDDGATAIEYGLIAAAVALGCVIAIFGFGDAVYDLVDDLIGLLDGPPPG